MNSETSSELAVNKSGHMIVFNTAYFSMEVLGMYGTFVDSFSVRKRGRGSL